MADIATRVPAKSILKQSTKKAPTVTDEQKARAETDKKNLSIALHHAYRIQGQKDIEEQILKAITSLLDYPSSVPFSPQDATSLVSLVSVFQPSDFNSLIEERCIDEKCGYALCSNRPRSLTMGKSAVWKLKQGMSDFCTTECAKKAMYIKAQLSEVPAWERTPEQQADIQLHELDGTVEGTEAEGAARRANRVARVDQWRNHVADDQELAMERGEKAGSFRPNQVMTETVVEKRPRSHKAQVPMLDELFDGAHARIEGYKPKPMMRGVKVATDEYDEESD